MRGPSIRVLAAALAFALPAALSPASADPTDGGLASWGKRAILLAADGGRDIMRLLPPSEGGETEAPPMPDLTFSPPSSGSGGVVPGQALRLSGHTVEVAIRFQPWPGHETLSYVGAQFDGITDPTLAAMLGLPREGGVFIADTTPEGPADIAGLRFGDFVTAIDGTPVSGTNQLVGEILAREPGTEGTLTVWRVAGDRAGYLAALHEIAEAGSTPAMLFLARLYSNGTGVPRDAAAAVGWYRKAALAGNTNGMLLYGDALAADTPKQDMAEAERWIRKSAEAGNVAAVYRLGRMYRDGEGRPRDAVEAVNLFRSAAERNYTPAMVALGLMLEGGSGIEADHLQAVQWYKRAAEAGDADGMAALGTMYSTGRGVERSYASAASWYDEGAKRGQLLALHNMAVLYDKGLGVTRNAETAADYIYRALELGYPFTYQQMTHNNRSWSREFRRALQQRLSGGGYYTGALDGAFGRSTLDAIDRMVAAR